MTHVKTLVLAAAALVLAAAAPARADNNDLPFDFFKLFSGSNMGTVGGSGPIPRQNVSIDTKYAPGTVIIRTSERRLYYVTSRGQAIRYGIGVGRQGFTWKGRETVSMKREWPSWRPPAEMRKRRPDLPHYMEGGPNNPLGARALYLGNTLFRIHGTNEPHTIGQAVSSGCIRMMNDDVIDLYNRVGVGTRVVVS